jgi:hypothetical protein
MPKQRSRKRRSRLASAFAQLSPAYKAVVALVGPICAIIGTLLALGVIGPVGDNDALAQSVQRTSEATTAAVAVTFKARDRAFDATGDFDYRSGWGRFRYDFGDGSGPIEARLHAGDVYINLPELGSQPWIHANLATAHDELADWAKAAGKPSPPADLASLGDLDFSDPSQLLERLRRASDVKHLGADRVYGIATERYRAVVAPRQRDDVRLVVTAWIDGDQLIRQLALAAPDGPAPFTVTMNFVKFGEPLDIRAPQSSRVRELGDVLDHLLAR